LKEIGRRKRRKGKAFLLYLVEIRKEFITKIKIISISSVETEVSREKPMQAKLRVNYFSLFQFLYLQ
jgi:hypothetical protein